MLHVLERAIRAGIWAGSLLVMVAYLLSSLSEPQSKETARSQPYSDDSFLTRTGHPPGPEESGRTPAFAFAQWSDRLGAWWFKDLDASSSSYREGEAVPLMLRIDNAAAGATYTITIRFDCAQGAAGLGYDFLSRYDRDRGIAPALAAGGPGTFPADASLAVPDNPAFAFDDGEGDRSFTLWGGYFANAVEEPEPDAACLSDGTGIAQGMYTLTARALADSVFLLWGGHLASGLDWGEGRGAASTQGLLHRHVVTAASDNGGWEGQAGIQAEAISPPN